MLRVYVGAQSTIYSLAFSPDGKYLAAAGNYLKYLISNLFINFDIQNLKFSYKY